MQHLFWIWPQPPQMSFSMLHTTPHIHTWGHVTSENYNYYKAQLLI